jgi:hypothetical protein
MTTTKSIVMSRVHTIHALRPFVSTAAFCVALVVVSVYAVSREVWVAMIVRNMPRLTDVVGLWNFFSYAFIHTGLLVQALSVVTVGASILLIQDSIKAFSLRFRPII